MESIMMEMSRTLDCIQESINRARLNPQEWTDALDAASLDAELGTMFLQERMKCAVWFVRDGDMGVVDVSVHERSYFANFTFPKLSFISPSAKVRRITNGVRGVAAH